MKAKFGILVLLLAAAMLRAQTNDLTALLQQGLFEEQASRNFDAAIANYSALAKQFDKDRQLAATAVFRLGECYRAQGRTNEAAAQYQRIVRDFSDQQTLATLSRQNLAGMGALKTETTAVENSDAQLLKRLDGQTFSELERILPTLVPDAMLNNLLEQRNETQAQRVSLLQTYATNNVRVLEKDALLVELHRQIADRISGVMQALKLRADLSPPQNTGDARQQQKELLAKQIALAEQDVAEAEKRKFGMDSATAQANIRTAQKEVLRLRQQLAALDSNKAELLDLSPPADSEEDREIQRIQTMIQNSPDLINARVGMEMGTPLIKSAYSGWLKVATYLLDHGADVNVAAPQVAWTSELQQARNVSPLLAAVAAGNKAMTKFLIERGANVNFIADNGKTPLRLAVDKNFPAVIQVLLESKADVNLRDKGEGSPLFSAVKNGQIKTIQVLLAAGANPNLEDNDGRTPLSFAAASGSPEIVKMLQAAKANPNGGKLDAPLLAAIHAKDVVSAELLLQAGANPNAKGEDDWQPNVLGSFGRPVGRGWETPMALAVSSGQLPMVKLLLKFRADPNIAQTDGWSVLFGALSDTNMLAALLEAGGKADARHPDEPFGGTLLDAAAAYTNLTAVQLLLKFKADPNDSNYERRSILFRALADTNILEALLDAGAKVDPVTPDETEWTPLAAAANQKNAAAVAILLKHGANPNFHNRNGVTPLHWAAYGHADSDVFKLLLDAKADPNVRTGNGRTPLDEIKGNQNPSSGGGIPISRLPRPGMIPAPGVPLSYVWSNGSVDTSSPDAPATNIVALLHQYGALDNLPNWDRIGVSRPADNTFAMIFHKSTNDWNHFTLLDLVYKTCSSYGGQFPFPDFSHVTVVRPGAHGAAEKRFEVNLLTATNTLDFFRDRPLQFGDVVEIPERGHTLAEHDDWLNDQYQKLVGYFRDHARAVRLAVAGGKTVQVSLNGFMPTDTYIGDILKSSAAQNALISGSDLSRVKVTRRELKTNQAHSWLLNCSRMNELSNSTLRNCPDLLLRDGDEIEVPLKP